MHADPEPNRPSVSLGALPSLAAGGANPSNTAPPNYTHGPQLLRWGIDSLYLSFPGRLSVEWDARLEALKAHAQSDDPSEQAIAQLTLGQHTFEVSRRGRLKFKFLLADAWYEIAVSSVATTALPLCWIKVSSRRLLDASLPEVLTDLRDLLAPFGLGAAPETVSRVDLYLDFSAAPQVPSIRREDWVRRCRKLAHYSDGEQVTGWAFGARGALSGRLYDKTREIEQSGKQYLLDVWRAAAWNGVDPVWRLEIQFGRELLKALQATTVAQLLPLRDQLWRYAMTDWLRLVVPGADSNRTRWKTDPLWAALSELDWGEAVVRPIERGSRGRIPNDDFLFVNGLGAVTSFMARESIDEVGDGFRAFLGAARRYHAHRSKVAGTDLYGYVGQQVARKRRQFNLPNTGLAVSRHPPRPDRGSHDR